MIAADARATPARERLAHETRAAHERLHALPVFAALQAGTLDLDGYRGLLGRLLGFHRPLERALVERADDLLAFGVRIDDLARVARIEADLAALGVPAATIATTPETGPWPRDRSTAWMFGTLYVREGATLGGRVLARHLDGLLGDAPAGRRFFAGDPHDGRRWNALCAALERVAEVAGTAELVDGANAAFERFERWATREAA